MRSKSSDPKRWVMIFAALALGRARQVSRAVAAARRKQNDGGAPHF
jgi:hypothetical protein